MDERARPGAAGMGCACEYVNDLIERGIFVMGGPFADDSGSQSLWEGVDLEEAHRIVREDPFIENGVFELEEIREWNIFVDELTQTGRSSAARALHAQPGVALPSRRDERLRRIHRRHGRRPEPPDQLDRERARTAANVEHALTGRYRREVGELGRKRHRVSAHEPVVRVGRYSEAHRAESTFSPTVP